MASWRFPGPALLLPLHVTAHVGKEAAAWQAASWGIREAYLPVQSGVAPLSYRLAAPDGRGKSFRSILQERRGKKSYKRYSALNSCGFWPGRKAFIHECK
jgi:hypothetical protein